LLALLTLAGLASGIFGDGVWDWFSWFGLGLPIVVAAYHIWRQWRLRPST